MERESLVCITCNRTYPRAERAAYESLRYFENYCICTDCLKKERVGWGEGGLGSQTHT